MVPVEAQVLVLMNQSIFVCVYVACAFGKNSLLFSLTVASSLLSLSINNYHKPWSLDHFPIFFDSFTPTSPPLQMVCLIRSGALPTLFITWKLNHHLRNHLMSKLPLPLLPWTNTSREWKQQSSICLIKNCADYLKNSFINITHLEPPPKHVQLLSIFTEKGNCHQNSILEQFQLPLKKAGAH